MILLAKHATDCLVALSDRMVTYLRGPPRDVKKYHLDKRGRHCVSPAGDGNLAKEVLRGLAHAKTGPADVLARIRGIAKDLHARHPRKTPSVNGFLIVVERQGPRLYSIGIRGGHVAATEDRGGMHAHGDGRAKALRECVAEKAGRAGMRCEEAARQLHVPASNVAEHVDSVGGRDEYGFDLVMFTAAGGAKVLERDTEWRGRIDVSFRMAEQAGPPAAHGGDIV